MTTRIAIVPAGAWGTALAVPAAAGGHDVALWRREPDWLATWNRDHPALPGLDLPANVRGVATAAEAVRDADLVILAPASVILRETCQMIRADLKPGAVLLSVVKGIDPESHLRMSEVVAAEIPSHKDRIAALSGPNFAHEVARQFPTGTVVACPDVAVAQFVQDLLMTQRFRIYTNPDIIGVELAGALKNVMALGVGLSDGLGMGDNGRAALITRGLTEMGRLGVAMGANVMTFAGLAGMGDLVLTCTSDSSRNRRAGLAIGRGGSAAEFATASHLTVEGIPTTKAAWTLAGQMGVSMPITEQIYRILYEGLPGVQGMENLMGRAKTHEVEEVLQQGFDL
ncbi:MAG TPA: NAD(P)H-dependent glycerol-3-phosphate dehydrogenase [Symbiobacteriaceae bacterium]|nr:NAD(P)H-dependent glycerol-3-phosphate dehydrogenase [Symbiobacteriaceae bacterium]